MRSLRESKLKVDKVSLGAETKGTATFTAENRKKFQKRS